MFMKSKIVAVIPAYNEREAIGLVVSELKELKNDDWQPLIDQIIVCDNGSEDLTYESAVHAGAKTLREEKRGYGAACKAAIAAIDDTDIVLFVDGDHAFEAYQAIDVMQPLVNGADLCIGSRTLGNIESGALTLPQRIGNTCASVLIRCLWRRAITDLGPFRAIRYAALQSLNMQDDTYGWTVEMQVKAIQMGLKIAEVPVNTRCRIGESKISGTVRGVFGAAIGIFSMIAKLWWGRHQRPALDYKQP